MPDGQAALEAARRAIPDLIVADVMMPRMDGFVLLRTLRADPELRDVPTILLSARAGEEAVIEGLDAMADEYLVKPFSARELIARVGAQLQLARLRRLAAEALRQRSAQFETLLNEAPLGVYLIDGDFLIRDMNPNARRLFGDLPDLIGRDFDEVTHLLWPKFADEVVRLFRHTLKTGQPYATPEHLEMRRGHLATEYYEWQINRIPLPDGRFGVVCYFRDISAHVQARVAL
ncbi:MAG: response regulator, partial [Gammaproteobacteria bacterium]